MTDPAHPADIDISPEQRVLEADAIVRRYATYSALGGLIPLPFIDVATVTGVQLKMLAELCRHYGVPFKANVGKELIGTLVAVAVPYNVGTATLMGLGPMLRVVPVLGPLVGVAVIPAFAAASTFALGRVFTKHFQTGGTLLNFDLESAKQSFGSEVEQAKADTAARNAGSKKGGAVIPAST
jgi:uncharacterized protein (DUF697 family)